MRRATEFSLDKDPDQGMVPSSDVLEFLKVVDGVSSTALQLAVDTQTTLRLAISSKIEKAMGVAHLRQDPLEKKKKGFIAPDTCRLIEEAAVQEAEPPVGTGGPKEGRRSGIEAQSQSSRWALSRPPVLQDF